MTQTEQPREDLPSPPSDPDSGRPGTTIQTTQSVGEMQGGKVTGVEIGTVTGPVYIQVTSAVPPSLAEELRQPILKTARFEPETVLIRAGPFVMGSDGLAAAPWERGQHELVLPDFRIGKYPVTVREYAAFIKDCKQQPSPREPREWFNREPPSDRLDHPVTGVSWHDALAYCAWLGQQEQTGRPYTLPSEAEWEKAASWGPGLYEKRTYPWGNEWLDGLCNMSGSGTTPVRAHAAGASAYGVQDLLGNVQEWTRSYWGTQPEEPEFGYPYDPDDDRREIVASPDLPPSGWMVHRGGYYKSKRAGLRCTARGNALADSKVAWRGFRVAIRIE